MSELTKEQADALEKFAKTLKGDKFFVLYGSKGSANITDIGYTVDGYAVNEIWALVEEAKSRIMYSQIRQDIVKLFESVNNDNINKGVV